ncbi:MAG TPA: enoyl-CoA hydratase-related protein [Rudaea sp.]|jgi:enoyl-CoA hydratase|uniref:enoyl-CoA hydratase/isomerase family protein n=1 Tax=Rudaea sp. TaxID=2136325 RepID=UPI002F932BEF
MAYRNLSIDDRGAVRRITINRPDKLNALNRETIDELYLAFTQARHDDSVRVVVLAGSGEKAFVAGADIGELATLTPLQAQEFSRRGQAMMLGVERLGKPVIARIQGFALGGGLELAMCCHLRIASDKARVGQPEINLGLIPGFGGTQRLLRLAGRAAALELCLTGAPIDAARAYSLGVLTRVVAADQLDAEIDALADQLAASAPHALAGILDTILVGGENGIEAGLDYEAQAFGLCFSSADMREGTQAFLERRKPVFSGK